MSSNYVEINFQGKKPVVVEECHYAEVVVQTPAKTTQSVPDRQIDERIFLVTKEYTCLDNDKTVARCGDILVSSSSKNNSPFGELLQRNPKSCSPKVSIPFDCLQLYIPASPKTSSGSLSPPAPGPNIEQMYATPNKSKPNNAPQVVKQVPSHYTEMNISYITKKDLDLILPLVVPEYQDKSKYSSTIFSVPAQTSPSLNGFNLKNRLMPIKKEKLSKLSIPKLDPDEEGASIQVFAVADRKAGNKEKDVLSFKKLQLGIMLYVSSSGWMLLRLYDGSDISIGWVPVAYWKVLSNVTDEYLASTSMDPWELNNNNNNDMEVSECQKRLMKEGEDRSFIICPVEENYMLLYKRNENVTSNKIIRMNDDTFTMGSHSFQTLHNLIIYFKRTHLLRDDSKSTLGNLML